MSPDEKLDSERLNTESLVGRRVRELRNRHALSLRMLAERSGLNVNTLCLIEGGKSSPSVGTLQQLAYALEVPITAFFESEPVEKKVVFTAAGQGMQVTAGNTQMQNLGKDLTGNQLQPFLIKLEPGAGSGAQKIVHTGYEFVYCVSGIVQYRIEEQEYLLRSGDSLVFEAHLPHCWQNTGDTPAEILLVFNPSDERDEPDRRHFSITNTKKELTMKIALITDDGKTISQHFGRAANYMVLTIEEGVIVSREMRAKLGHQHFHNEHEAGHVHSEPHGFDPVSHDKHVNMAEAIADCKVIICGGMGRGAYESMRRLNIQPVVTDIRDIAQAAQAFLDGKLIDHTELLH